MKRRLDLQNKLKSQNTYIIAPYRPTYKRMHYLAVILCVCIIVVLFHSISRIAESGVYIVESPSGIPSRKVFVERLCGFPLWKMVL